MKSDRLFPEVNRADPVAWPEVCCEVMIGCFTRLKYGGIGHIEIVEIQGQEALWQG